VSRFNLNSTDLNPKKVGASSPSVYKDYTGQDGIDTTIGNESAGWSDDNGVCTSLNLGNFDTYMTLRWM